MAPLTATATARRWQSPQGRHWWRQPQGRSVRPGGIYREVTATSRHTTTPTAQPAPNPEPWQPTRAPAGRRGRPAAPWWPCGGHPRCRGRSRRTTATCDASGLAATLRRWSRWERQRRNAARWAQQAAGMRPLGATAVLRQPRTLSHTPTPHHTNTTYHPNSTNQIYRQHRNLMMADGATMTTAPMPVPVPAPDAAVDLDDEVRTVAPAATSLLS